MANILIRNLPAAAHRQLAERAAARGESLQQYLLAELVRLAERPNMAEVLTQIERAHDGGHVGLRNAVEDLRAARGER